MRSSTKQLFTLTLLIGYLGISILLFKKNVGSARMRESDIHPQSKDSSPTIPTYRQKGEKGKNSRRLYIQGMEQIRQIKEH